MKKTLALASLVFGSLSLGFSQTVVNPGGSPVIGPGGGTSSPYTLPPASTNNLGGVKCDGTTTLCATDGTVSTVAIAPVATTIKYPGLVNIAGSSRYGVNPENGGLGVDTVQGYVSYLVPFASTDLSLIFENAQDVTETCGPAATITASIEYPPDSGKFRRISFANGQPSVTIAPCGVVHSDPLAIETTATAQTVRARFKFTRSPTDATGIVANWPYGNIVNTNMGTYTTSTTGGHWDGVEELKTRTVADGVCTASSTAFTSATAAFTAQDAGQTITLTGCGAAGANLSTTIASYTNVMTVVLANAASTAAAGVTTAIVPTDKTMGGTIYNAAGRIFAYGPHALFGKQVNQPSKGISCVGDSITAFAGDFVHGTWCPIAASYANMQADVTNLTPQIGTIMYDTIPYLNEGMSGETYLNISGPTLHTTRFALLDSSKYTFVQLGTNDIIGGLAFAPMQAAAITTWKQIGDHGPQVFVGTVPPRTGSTDEWMSLAGQTYALASGNTIRISFNNWLRDGAPITCSTGVAAATGSTGSDIVRTDYYDITGTKAGVASGTACTHPLLGTIEMADGVESSRDSGIWKIDPRQMYFTGCNVTAGLNAIITCSGGGNFPSYVSFDMAALYGAGTSGGTLTGQIIYQTPTTLEFNGTVPTTCNNCNLTLGAVGNPNNVQNYGIYTSDGIHPSSKAIPPFAQGVAGVISGLAW